MGEPGIRIFIARSRGLDPAFVRECAARLSPAERAEFARMSDPRVADVRAVLRVEANRWRTAGAKVSVAHSGEFGVLATPLHGSHLILGVDCEPWAGDIPEVSQVRDITSDEEFVAWSALPKSARRRAFVRLWTLKEAALKARGTGLSGGMSAVRVRPDFSGLDEPGWFSAFVEADSPVWHGRPARVAGDAPTGGTPVPPFTDHAVSVVWGGGPATVHAQSIADSPSF